MEGNKEEARKAMDIAEKKLSKNDYLEAKKFVNKAHNLYPKLDGLNQVLIMIDVFISASNGGGGGEADWYGILGVDPLADDETVKKQYKKLALLLHPDKNKFNGAEEAFKLILNACSLLSDKDKRSAYDRKRKWKEVTQKKGGKKPNPTSNNNKPKPKPKSEYYENAYDPKYDSDSDECEYDYEPKRKHETKPDCSWKQEKEIFWTKCNRCNTYCEFVRANYLNKTMTCPNCSQEFVATEILPEMINGRPVMRFSFPQYHQEEQSISKNTSDDDKTSSSTSTAFDRLFKKLMTSTGNANSTSEAEKLFKKLVTDVK